MTINEKKPLKTEASRYLGNEDAEKFWIEDDGGRLIFLMPICQGCGRRLGFEDISEPVLVDEFVGYDPERDCYNRARSYAEKCKFCGYTVNTFTDVEDDVPREEYEAYIIRTLEQAGLDAAQLAISYDDGLVVVKLLKPLGDEWNQYNEVLVSLGMTWIKGGCWKDTRLVFIAAQERAMETEEKPGKWLCSRDEPAVTAALLKHGGFSTVFIDRKAWNIKLGSSQEGEDTIISFWPREPIEKVSIEENP